MDYTMEMDVKDMIVLYPYVHIVTWGLPKRYLGLLRIFNLPLEEYPHQFITQSPETLNSYELQVTKKSISPFQPKISTDDLAKPKKAEIEEEEEIQNASTFGDSPTPRKKRRPKKKPVISIKVKLDDDLSNLKRANGKNFDKILSRCSKRSCLLVIEKHDASKKDEYSLNFVNNTSYSKPYSKLLRKNRRKNSSSICGSPPKDYEKPQRSLCSEFSEENIHPFLKVDKKFFSDTITNFHEISKQNSNDISKRKIAEKGIESKEEFNENDRRRNIEMATEENQLVPNEELPHEEKPLRNWPVITQLFDKDHIEIYKNYLKSLSSKKEEEENDETQENIQEEAGIVSSSSDTSGSEPFPETSKPAPLLKDHNSPKSKSSKTQNAPNDGKPQETTRNFKFPEVPTAKNLFASFRTESSTKRNYFDKLNNTNTTVIIEKPVVSYYSVVSEKSPFVDNGSQKTYTSTAYLHIGEDEKSKNEDKNNTLSDVRNVVNSKSDPKANMNMRLLSTPMKTYESIKKNVEEKTFYTFEGGCDEENLNQNIVEKTKNHSDKKVKGIKRLCIFNIVLALFVTVVLGIIFFISIADTSTITRVVEKYIK